jgi:hypothetical protein
MHTKEEFQMHECTPYKDLVAIPKDFAMKYLEASNTLIRLQTILECEKDKYEQLLNSILHDNKELRTHGKGVRCAPLGIETTDEKTIVKRESPKNTRTKSPSKEPQTVEKLCEALMKSGQKKGQQCTYKAKSGVDFCSRHAKCESIERNNQEEEKEEKKEEKNEKKNEKKKEKKKEKEEKEEKKEKKRSRAKRSDTDTDYEDEDLTDEEKKARHWSNITDEEFILSCLRRHKVKPSELVKDVEIQSSGKKKEEEAKDMKPILIETIKREVDDMIDSVDSLESGHKAKLAYATMKRMELFKLLTRDELKSYVSVHWETKLKPFLVKTDRRYSGSDLMTAFEHYIIGTEFSKTYCGVKGDMYFGQTHFKQEIFSTVPYFKVWNDTGFLKPFCSDEVAFFPLDQILQRAMRNVNGFSSLIHVKQSGECPTDPYSFYKLEYIREDGVRAWRMDCRLEETLLSMYECLKDSISYWLNHYNVKGGKGEYRYCAYRLYHKGGPENAIIDQLMKNMFTITDVPRFYKMVQDCVQEYQPTSVDKLITHLDEPEVKTRFDTLRKTYTPQPERIEMIREVFTSMISKEEIEEALLKYGQRWRDEIEAENFINNLMNKGNGKV